MLREIVSSVGPILGLCHTHPSLAELGLLTLISFLIGCCCGGIFVGFLVSGKLRSLAGGRAEIRTSTSKLPSIFFPAVREVPMCICSGPAGLHGSQELLENEGGQHRLARKAVE